MATKKNSTDLVESGHPLDGEVSSSQDDFQELVRKSKERTNFVPSTIEELTQFFESEGGVIEVEGSPWESVTKQSLVGKPFYIVHVKFFTGTYGPAVALLCFIRDEMKRVVISDGSTGIFQQIKGMVERTGRFGGYIVRNGLRVSEYTYTQKDFFGNPIGEPVPAKTYYLS
jgi:hypothetical protein